MTHARVGYADASIDSELDDLKSMLSEERNARRALSEKLDRLVEDSNKQQAALSGEVDAVRESVRALKTTEDESTR
eukprot:SAG31_NODE_3253_length_4489_cov_3.514351_3_plen_76_part_00